MIFKSPWSALALNFLMMFHDERRQLLIAWAEQMKQLHGHDEVQLSHVREGLEKILVEI